MNIQLIEKAIDRARAIDAFTYIPDGFRQGTATRSRDFGGAAFELDGEDWVLTRSTLVSSHFQLIDATVRQKYERKSKFAVAILNPPIPGKRLPQEPDASYLKKFQEIAWRAFRVAWVLGEGAHAWKFLGDPEREFDHDDIDEVTRRIAASLDGKIDLDRSSRATEKRIFEQITKANLDLGVSEKKSYRGLWRRPIADAVWKRSTTSSTRTLGVEIKVTEDANCPLCQPLELLARVDAVIRIRLVAAGSSANETEWCKRAKREFAEAVPVRYLDVHAQ